MLPYFQAESSAMPPAAATASDGRPKRRSTSRANRLPSWPAPTPREIVFTSGATESNNLAHQRRAEATAPATTSSPWRPSTKPCSIPIKHLEQTGVRTTILPPRPDGLLDLDALRDAIQPRHLLVSVMFANNEIGVIQPVREIGAICRERGVLFHCDAAQAFGKMPVDVADDHIDLHVAERA